ncbi:MAG: hypothetical protein LH647_08555 [Leptolyngbyaceae cyanobacterium CAN_BIN12]|nr:hypothetical protein [Leptolyngbyaceae cyanobacterium CAN_BIN12]
MFALNHIRVLSVCTVFNLVSFSQIRPEVKLRCSVLEGQTLQLTKTIEELMSGAAVYQKKRSLIFSTPGKDESDGGKITSEH